jgi:hypothetical protein
MGETYSTHEGNNKYFKILITTPEGNGSLERL